MKRNLLFIVGVLLVYVLLSATDASKVNKVWIMNQGVAGDMGQYQVVFIQDLETNTRCYAIVGRDNSATSSINCIPANYVTITQPYNGYTQTQPLGKVK